MESKLTVANTPFVFLERGLLIPPQTLTIANARTALDVLRDLGNVTKWCEMDLIMRIFLEEDEAWSQLIDQFDYSMQTLYTYRKVYLAFPTQEDRKWNLHYSHYKAVSGDYLSDYERGWFLDWAVEERMGSDALFAEVSRYHQLRDGKHSLPSFDARSLYVDINRILSFLKKSDLLEELPNGLLESLNRSLEGYKRLVLKEMDDE